MSAHPGSDSEASALRHWLAEAGVPHLEGLLRAHAIDVDVLGSLSEADLAQIGVAGFKLPGAAPTTGDGVKFLGCAA